MLHVCGITFDHTTNYGSSFQAYALQAAVEKISLSDGTKCSYQLIPIRKCEDWPVIRTWKHLLVAPFVALNRRMFVEFEQEHMHYAETHRISDFVELNSITDAFVCGSDVIWNPDLNKNIDAFYLNFATKYRFSYAASFGKSEISENTRRKVAQYLPAFNSLSVREKSGIDIIQNSIGFTAQIVCDPVFLVDRNEWEEIIRKEISKKKYIFVYITHLSRPIERFLERLKHSTGLNIVYAANGPKQALKQGLFQVQTPDKWLQLLHDAQYVVTNSFHATAFSVLFHKKFFTVVNGEKSKGINVRMYDFLSTIGLTDRIFSEIPEELDLSEINYRDIDPKIEAIREKSLEFLRENLEAAYRDKLEREKT